MSWWEWVFSGVGVPVFGKLRQWLSGSRNPQRDAGITAQGARVSDSPVASGTGITQIVGDHHHHYPPAPAKQPEPKPKPRPNLVFVGGKEKQVFISPFSFGGFSNPRNSAEEEVSVTALVFKFENRTVPDRPIGRAMNVIAQVRYQSEDRMSDRRLDYSVWLSSGTNTTTFDAGDTCELVLMSDINKEILAFEDKRTDLNAQFSEFRYFDTLNIEGFPFLEITLIDQTSQATFQFSFKVWRQGQRFCILQTA
jgi:hypothetical protein